MKKHKLLHLLSLKLYKPPFTHKKEDFMIRIVQSWFSEEWINFEYSANGGITWDTIKHAEAPFDYLKENWSWSKLTYRINKHSTFDYELEKFSSYNKILQYEKEQEKIYYDGIEEVKAERRAYYKGLRDTYNRINKKIKT